MIDEANTRLLVIDDDPSVRDAFALALRPRSGRDPALDAAARTLFDERQPSDRAPSLPALFRLDIASDGAAGIRRVEAAVRAGDPYAVLFCDIRMPGLDGVATVEQIRALDPALEVVFVTAYTDRTLDEIVERVGRDVSYLVKPFVVEEVYQLATRLTLQWNRARWSERVARQYERAEQLLHSLMPPAVADRLTRGAAEVADLHDATVLFADLVGFTQWSKALKPFELLRMLKALFQRFEVSAARHGVRRIRLMGDGYMAATGLDDGGGAHASRMVAHALDLLAIVDELRDPAGNPLGVRIGIDAGPVVAGVLGGRDLRYDVWGTTVSIAARLESHGESGRVHVSDEVARRVAADFAMERRGVIQLKGLGESATWWILGAGVGPERSLRSA